jgi:hypothetical protein
MFDSELDRERDRERDPERVPERARARPELFGDEELPELRARTGEEPVGRRRGLPRDVTWGVRTKARPDPEDDAPAGEGERECAGADAKGEGFTRLRELRRGVGTVVPAPAGVVACADPGGPCDAVAAGETARDEAEEREEERELLLAARADSVPSFSPAPPGASLLAAGGGIELSMAPDF